MFDLGKLVFDLIFQLIIGVIDEKLKSSTLSYLEQRKIRRRVEDATADVVESLVPFLAQEKISQEKQERLIETCIRELKPFAENPAELFKGSLNGQKIFENLYLNKELPQVIIEDNLKDTYSLLFPRIATLLCKIPAAVNDWENEAWSENFRRFDEVVAQLRALFAQVDELSTATQKGADITLIRFKQMLTQKIGLQLDITGLRADQPYSGKFDDFFVLPEIKKVVQEGEKGLVSITEPKDCFDTFIISGRLNIIIGAPGAGKSTWSKWLQRETLRSDWAGIGIRIEFRDLKSDELPSIYELVRKVAGRQLAEDLTSEKITKWLDNCRIAFILDGFDEIRPTDRVRFIEWIKEISQFAKGCAFVITSRPLTTNHLEILGDSWQKWAIESFDKSRIINYISKWYDNSPLLSDSDRKVDANGLAEEWLKDSVIGQLTGNPLLLSTLLMVHHLDGKLPNGRANLYKRYVDGMLGIWDDRHKLTATDIQLSPTEKRKIIRGIALYLFLSEQETIDEHILVEWLTSYLPKIEIKASATDVLLILRERSGLIIGPGIYSFAHKTIAEFLVAETVIQGDQKDTSGKRIDRFRLFEHRDDDRWNAVVFLWSGLASFSDIESFVHESIKVSNWALALGIMFDQYDRFLFEPRRKILLKLIASFPSSLFGKNIKSYWIANSHPAEKYLGDIQIPRQVFEIRSLHKRVELDREITRSFYDNTITWTDCVKAKGKLYNLLWFQAASHPKSLDEWESVFKSRFPKEVQKINYFFIIASWNILRQAEQRLETELVIQTLLRVYPASYSFIPLIIISNIIWMILFDPINHTLLSTTDDRIIDVIESIKEEKLNRISNALKILIEWQIDKIDDRFLISSSSWMFHITQGIDLINIITDLIKILHSRNRISTEIAQPSLEFFKKLEVRRNLILDTSIQLE